MQDLVIPANLGKIEKKERRVEARRKANAKTAGTLLAAATPLIERSPAAVPFKSPTPGSD